MTAKIFYLDKHIQTSPIEDVGKTQSLKPQINATTWDEHEGVRPRRSGGIGSTGLDDVIVENVEVGSLPVERMYPHVFDEDIKAGQCLVYLRSAINDAHDAIDAFGEPDLQAVGTRLAQIAVTMGKAHSLTEFNESLGGVVSFIRRATLVASNDELSRSALNSLLNVLELAAANPMMDLDEASDLVDKLSNEGWHGEHRLANEIIMALVDSSELPADEMQALLFPEP